MKGRSLSVSNISQMLKQSYETNPQQNINDFVLDKELSTDECKVITIIDT